MSDTYRRSDRYQIEYTHDEPWDQHDTNPRYRLIDTATDEPVRGGMSRTAALAAASRLNGRDMTPEQDRKEGN